MASIHEVITKEDVLLSLTRLMHSILLAPVVDENKLIQMAENLDHLEELV